MNHDTHEIIQWNQANVDSDLHLEISKCPRNQKEHKIQPAMELMPWSLTFESSNLNMKSTNKYLHTSYQRKWSHQDESSMPSQCCLFHPTNNKSLKYARKRASSVHGVAG